MVHIKDVIRGPLLCKLEIYVIKKGLTLSVRPIQSRGSKMRYNIPN